MPLQCPASSFFFLILILILPLVSSQQPYEGLHTTDCSNSYNSSSLLGYFCNGNSTSCNSYLTFHPTSPYNTAASISSLLNVDESLLSQSTLNSNSMLVIPVDCSCSNTYYQFNATYSVQSGDTAFIIANNTFQALSTCQAIINQNLPNASSQLQVGENLTVPLRCACPTTQQFNSGIRYLLTYLVNSGDNFSSIAQTFGVDADSIADANELSLSKTINFFTTLLIPLKTKPNFTQISVLTPPPPPPPASPSPNKKKSNHTGVYSGIAVAAFVFLMVMVLVFVLLKKRRSKKSKDEVVSSNIESKPIKKNDIPLDILKGISGIGSFLKIYAFQELQLATNNFSLENQIRGSVYRGTFQGDLAVVKRFDRDMSMEIDMLKQINHFNLIRLSGISFNEGYWYLVYEYAENGSLSDWIWDKDGSRVLNWGQRLQISVDVANGLNYLHSFTDPAYVHMDIRTDGILLDSNLRGKISNLTNARPAKGREGEFTMTQHIAGMQGYLAPEYLEHGLVSPKIDVYALGIVLLEIFTGKENGIIFDEFHEMVKEEILEENVKGFVDPLMEANFSVDSAVLLIALIKRCIEMEASNRPSMAEVVQHLTRMSGMSTSWYSSYDTGSFSSEKVLLKQEE
ncbi:lysM domain receptor-like kinase 4 [Carex rostrata]